MAIEVIENLIEGHRYRFNYTVNELVRVFFVSGLTQGTGTLVQAASAVDASDSSKKIPNFATPHPDNPKLIADDYDIYPYPAKSKTSAIVRVLYHPAVLSPTFQPVIEFDATDRQVTTSYDVFGNPINVVYTPPGGTASTEIGQITSLRSYGILTIERVEYEDPTPRIVFQDKMNLNTFWGTSKGTWLVRKIKIRKLLYTSGYNVLYTLEYDPRTHIKTAIYRDTITGDIPKDVNTNPNPMTVSGNGWKNVQDNLYIDFGGLSLPPGFEG